MTWPSASSSTEAMPEGSTADMVAVMVPRSGTEPIGLGQATLGPARSATTLRLVVAVLPTASVVRTPMVYEAEAPGVHSIAHGADSADATTLPLMSSSIFTVSSDGAASSTRTGPLPTAAGTSAAAEGAALSTSTPVVTVVVLP